MVSIPDFIGSITARSGGFDLDVPEAIELRRNFFSQSARYSFIAKSVTDFAWIEDIPKGKATLFIAEGLLMYFTEEDVKLIIKTIAENFRSSEILLEAMSPFVARRTKQHLDIKKYDATFKWGIASGKAIENWNIGVQAIGEFYYFDMHKEVQSPVLRLLCLVPAFRKMMKIVHLRIM